MNLENEFECYAAIQEIGQLYSECWEMVDYLKAINGASGAINTLKALADLAVKSQGVELREQLLNLRDEMLDLKTALIEAKEENLELREESKALKSKVAELESGSQEKLLIIDHVYYTQSNDGPFCTGCYDSKKERIRLNELPEIMRPMGKYKCPVCGEKFGKNR